MNIIKRQIAYNRTKRTSAIKYIVIHDTGNKKKGADAMAHYNYFNGGDRQSSADFFVDDKSVMQINDYKKYYTWAVGDGKGKYGITNSNSVSIEICVNEDGDYKEAYLKAVELTKMLMTELNIPADRVVRHYDASRKNCPASMSSGNWAYWQDFKNRISETRADMSVETLLKEIDTLKKEISALKAQKEKVYHYTIEVPEYARPTIQKMLDKGILKGESKSDLNITDTFVKAFVVIDRAGLI